MLLRLDTQSQ